MTSIFLSGAIEGVADLGMAWRNEATERLTFLGYKVFSPIVSPNEQVFFKPFELVDRNFWLQQKCDLLLVEYMIPNRSYVGTDVELTKAKWDYEQPRIVFAHESYHKRLYLKYLATVILNDLQEAIDYITAFYPSEQKGI